MIDEVEIGYDRAIRAAMGKADSDLANWLAIGLKEYQCLYKDGGSEGDDEYGMVKDAEQVADHLPPGWKL